MQDRVDRDLTREEQPLAIGDEHLSELEERIGTSPARISILLLGFVGSLMLILLMAIIARDVFLEQSISIDRTIYLYLRNHASSFPGPMFALGTYLGSFIVIGPLTAATCALLFAKGYRSIPTFLVVSVVGGILVNKVFKDYVTRPRPSWPGVHQIGDYSFPSGHAMNSVVFYIALASIIWVLFGKLYGTVSFIIAIFLALFIGASRIYFGYHYFTDVIGGYIAGLLWVVIAATATQGGSYIIRQRRANKAKT